MFDEILLFISVIKHGKFINAAKALGLAQSTVSRKIEALESKLGVMLIKRDSKNLVLTEKGLLLYNNFKDCETELLQKLNPITGPSNKVSGKLSILLPFTLAHYAITPYLGEFLAQYPELEIVCPYNFSDFNMRKEDYDIALINYLPKQTSQKVKLILSFKLMLVCTVEYIEKHGILDSIDDFDKHLIVGNITPNNVLPPYAKLYHEKTGDVINIRNKFRIRANNFLMAKQIVDSSYGIAGLPFPFIKDELESGRLVRLLPELHAGVVNCYLMRNIEENDIRYKVFYKFLQECLERIPRSNLSTVDLKHIFSA